MEFEAAKNTPTSTNYVTPPNVSGDLSIYTKSDYDALVSNGKLDVLAQIYAESFSGPPWFESWDLASAKNEIGHLLASGAVLVVAYDLEGKVLGHALSLPIRNLQSRVEDARPFSIPEDTFYFESFCVAPEARGNKIGAKLLEVSLDIGKRNGFSGMLTRTRFNNISAIKTFEKCGLSFLGKYLVETGAVSSERVVYYVRFEDKNAMGR